jgi:hypothetical protein
MQRRQVELQRSLPRSSQTIICGQGSSPLGDAPSSLRRSLFYRLGLPTV